MCIFIKYWQFRKGLVLLYMGNEPLSWSFIAELQTQQFLVDIFFVFFHDFFFKIAIEFFR